jgi:pyrroloquinoline quinone (PQQ) biosynthesis protein C
MDVGDFARRAMLPADGEAVWFWRPKAGAKSLEQSAATVTTTRLVTGKSAEETVKTIAQGRSG